MQNYIQPGVNLTVPAPATVVSGTLVVIGNIVGIAAGDAASGEDLDLVTEGVFSYPKVSADVLAVGDPVYFDGAEVGVESTGSDLVGTCVQAAGNGVTTAYFKL